MTDLVIGIDPGVTTGYAEARDGKLCVVMSMKCIDAMDAVRQQHRAAAVRMVVFEDARLRKWFGSKGAEALQGAGSIKRECQLWADFLCLLGVPYKAIAPAQNRTKVPADRFKALTGWQGRTNEHARDAAMLVWKAR